MKSEKSIMALIKASIALSLPCDSSIFQPKRGLRRKSSGLAAQRATELAVAAILDDFNRFAADFRDHLFFGLGFIFQHHFRAFVPAVIPDPGRKVLFAGGDLSQNLFVKSLVRAGFQAGGLAVPAGIKVGGAGGRQRHANAPGGRIRGFCATASTPVEIVLYCSSFSPRWLCQSGHRHFEKA